MKACVRCREEKPHSEFTKKKAAKDGRNPACRVCTRVATKRHYENNKEVYKKKAYNHKKKTQTWLNLLKDVPCMDCGGSYPPYVMDFDHVRGEKAFTISREAGNRSLSDMADEVSKCEIVCSNCHRIRTHLRARQLDGARPTKPGRVGSSPTEHIAP